MAYDPKDPADKKIVDGLIAEALAEAQAENDTATAGLKAKNTQLLTQLKKAEKGEGDPAEVARLEGELETAQTKLAETTKALKTATKAAETATAAHETEAAFSRRLLVDNGLTEALVANNVAPQFLPAAKALLAGQVTVKAEGDNRLAVVGDKSLGDFVKEWSQGDNGKPFVAAPGNGGGGAPGGKAGGGTGAKTMTRAAYNEANKSDPTGVAKFFAEGGTLTE